jgi:hypothetical protein
MSRMSAKTNLAIVLLLAAAGGAGWFALRSAREAEALLSQAANDRAARQAEVRRYEERSARHESELDQTRKLLDQLQSQPSADTRSGPIDERTAKAEFASDPAQQAALIRLGRAMVAETYAPLFRKLGLSPEQIDRFESLMSEADERKIDIQAGALTAGLEDSAGAAATAKRDAESRLHAAQLELLGETGFRQLQEFDRTQSIREWVVWGLAGDLTFTKTPLSAHQGEQLTQILANACPSYRSGGPTDEDEVDWPTALEQAKGILSEPQWAALKSVAASRKNGQFFIAVQTLVDRKPAAIGRP